MYSIKNYGNRVRPQFSIDEVYDSGKDSGKFINQVAYWFKTREKAEARLKEIIAEDAAKVVTKISQQTNQDYSI